MILTGSCTYCASYEKFAMATGSGARFVGREAIATVLKERFEDVSDICWADSRSWICGNRTVTE